MINKGGGIVFLQADGLTGPGVLQMFLPFIIMIAVFYFLLIRPQQAQQKKRQSMLSALAKGDKVVTVGGVYGEITAVKEDYIALKIAEKVEIKVSRTGISSVIKS